MLAGGSSNELFYTGMWCFCVRFFFQVCAHKYILLYNISYIISIIYCITMYLIWTKSNSDIANRDLYKIPTCMSSSIHVTISTNQWASTAEISIVESSEVSFTSCLLHICLGWLHSNGYWEESRCLLLLLLGTCAAAIGTLRDATRTVLLPSLPVLQSLPPLPLIIVISINYTVGLSACI